MRNVLDILTPENVHIEYELAGLGSRIIALLLDSLVQLILIGLTGGLMFGVYVFRQLNKLDSIMIAIGIVLLFLILFVYHILFEMLINGQTPGKIIMRLRVIKQNGEPINIWESIIRNAFRIPYYIVPGLYIVGALFVLFTRNYKRIGDYAANTIVVKIRKDERPLSLDEIIDENKSIEETGVLNIYPVNSREYSILREFLSRKDNLGDRRTVFAYHLNRYFMKKFNIENPIYESPYDFFEQIISMNSGM